VVGIGTESSLKDEQRIPELEVAEMKILVETNSVIIVIYGGILQQIYQKKSKVIVDLAPQLKAVDSNHLSMSVLGGKSVE
jgi:hypothetical protein